MSAVYKTESVETLTHADGSKTVIIRGSAIKEARIGSIHVKCQMPVSPDALIAFKQTV